MYPDPLPEVPKQVRLDPVLGVVGSDPVWQCYTSTARVQSFPATATAGPAPFVSNGKTLESQDFRAVPMVPPEPPTPSWWQRFLAWVQGIEVDWSLR